MYKLNIWAIVVWMAAASAPASDLPLMFQGRTLAKAAPDECFFGLGDTNNLFISTGIDCDDCYDVGGQPKVNQAYVWGLTRAGDDLWFGTGPNINSLVAGGYMHATNPSLRGCQAQEFYLSEFARDGLVPGELGDWRPPDIFVYALQDGPLVRLDETFPAYASNLLWDTVGLRSAGTSAPNGTHTNGVVILAGPSLTATTGGGIIMYAFDAASRSLIDARRFTEFINIRKWLKYEDVLYTAVTTTNSGGHVLRWLNNPGHADYPLAFEIVGNLDNGGAELAVHEGRLFVGTWPGIEGQQEFDPIELLLEPAGVFMSPEVPSGGLTSSDADDWDKMWNIMEYEVDQVCGAVTGIGALESYGGYLYWGTMQVPALTYYAHTVYYGPPTNQAHQREIYVNSWRPIAIFRGWDFRPGGLILRPTCDVDLLYGETNLMMRGQVLNPSPSSPWYEEPNAAEMPPKYGSSGFGDWQNNYTWTMALYKDKLFVGTMRNHYLRGREFPDATDGAHLWCFDSTSEPAKPVSRHGAGNYSAYGIRTILSDTHYLYLGMANPMNLMTDRTDDRPEGGWEIIRLQQIFDDTDWDHLPDDWETEHYGGPTNAAPGDYSDDDKVNNRGEFIAGTDPWDANDYFSITNASMQVSGSHRLHWAGVSGRVYRVMQAADLNGPWEPVGTVTGNNETIAFKPPPGAEPTVFYRIQVRLKDGLWVGP